MLRAIRRFFAMSNAVKEKVDESSSDPRQFPLFAELPDAAQFHVLSFVATAPWERLADGAVVNLRQHQQPQQQQQHHQGTLTAVLPWVCRKFRSYSQSERLWRLCLARALATDRAWKDALGRMAPHLATNADVITIAEAINHVIPALLQLANVSTCQNLYQVLWNDQLRIRSPIFFMPMEFDPTERRPRYQLHFFEPRYRLMMAELLQGVDRATLGAAEDDTTDDDDRPVFLHVVDRRGPAATAAALVRVVACVFAPDGRCVADLQVVGSVRLQRCWVRPQSFSLYYGDGYRCDGLPLVPPRVAPQHHSLASMSIPLRRHRRRQSSSSSSRDS